MLGVIGLAFALRLYHLDFQSLWRDEVDAILFASRDWLTMLAMFSRAGENGPLYFVMLWPSLSLLGEAEFAVRFSSVMCGVLAVPLTCALGRKILSACEIRQATGQATGATAASLAMEGGQTNWAPMFAALLVACSPYLVWYSQEAKMYALLVCLTAASLRLLWSALCHNRPIHWAGYVVLTSLSFYTHILAVALLPAHVLLFVAGGKPFWRRWRPALVVLGCLTLPYLPLARWEIPVLLSSFETGHPFYPLPDMLYILFTLLSFGFRAPALPAIGTVVFVLLAGSILYRTERGLTPNLLARRPQIALWICFLVPVIGVYLISLGMPIFADRYLIAIAVPFYLLLACGLEALRQRSYIVWGLCLIALLWINGQGAWVQSQTRLKADFRSAAAHFAKQASPQDLVIVQMPYVHRTFEYYYRQPYRRADGLYTNGGMTADQVAKHMAELTDGEQTIWLLKSEAEMWDRRNLVQQWLDDRCQRTAEAHFERVELYRYVCF